MKINKQGTTFNLEINTDEDIKNMKNGDYQLVHLYDNEQLKQQIKLGKIDQLVIWINQTFKYKNIPLDNSIILAAYNLFHSNNDDFIKLVEWLNRDFYD